MKAKVVMVQEFPVEGIMRLRVDTFREPGEHGYEEHYVQVPLYPEPAVPYSYYGYPGKLEEIESAFEGEPPKLVPVDQADYNAWVESLPKVWQNNPCLCQFIKIPIGASWDKIIQITKAHTKRVKEAKYRPTDGLPDVLDKQIVDGLAEHLASLGVNKVKVKTKSIPGLDAIKPNHKLLGLEVVE
uniref:Uncharacterized protein n=1 Tax=viral metagenome TaxID=1070528 RepID=A0A6M3XSQ7_9ZZZZ